MKKYLVWIGTTIFCFRVLAMPAYFSFPEQIKIADVIVEAKISVSNDVPYADVLNVLRGNPPKNFSIIKIDRNRFLHKNWEEYSCYEKVLVFLKNPQSGVYKAIGVNDICLWPKYIENFPYPGMVTSYDEVISNFNFIQGLFQNTDHDQKLNDVIFATKFSKPFTKIVIRQFLSFTENSDLELDARRSFYSLRIAGNLSKESPLIKHPKVEEYLNNEDIEEQYKFLYDEWNRLDYLAVYNSTNAVLEEEYMNFIDSEIQAVGCNFIPFIIKMRNGKSGDIWLNDFWTYVTKTSFIQKYNPWRSDRAELLLSGGREQAQARTRFLLNEYRLAIKENRGYDRIYAEMAIRAMGVFAWATVAEEAKKGDALAIKIFKDIFYKQIPNYDSLEECFKYWDRIKNRYTLPPQSSDFKGDYGLDKWKRTGK